MTTSRVFGPYSSDGIPVSAGQKLSVRVVQASGVTRTLDNLQFGVSQLEPEGSGGVLLPVLGDGGGGGWTPVVEPSVYSGGIDDTVRKIDFGTTELWSFTGHTNNVVGVAVDPDGNVYSASDDGTVRKIDPDGTEVWSFTGHTSSVVGVAVDPGIYGAFG